RILLVEDDAINRDVLSRYLTLVGYDIIIAVNGVQALDLAQTQRPDIILMDMRLPLMDGWQTTRMLKDSPSTAMIPVIALTAYALDDERQKCFDAGCDAYESKPVDMPHLLASIQGLVQEQTS
ncbi:MAG TPA: response regulator, partial [Roseiflexaceae bacterium]|nr:response regulator [Roseiflexaceae bacterium]